MSIRAELLLAILTFSAAAFGQEGTANPRLSIQVGSFQPRLIDLASKDPCTLDVQVNRKATVRLIISDWDGEVVARIEQECEKGEHQIRWDRKFEKREPFDGVYTFRVEAQTAEGERIGYDPGLDSGLVLLPVQKFTFDSTGRKIEYVMPKLGMARIRLFRENNLLVRTVQEWTPVLAGGYKLTWDGKDQSGLPVSDKDLSCRISAYSLPENALIVSGVGKGKPARTWEAQMAWCAKPELKEKYLHARLPREQAHEPRIALEFPGQDPAKAKQPVEVNGSLQVRVRIDPQDEACLVDERFEVCVFIDGVFFFEDEDGTTPYTFNLEPAGFNEGTHLLSVMVMGANDHVGVCSIPFVYKATRKAVKERN